MIKKTPIIHITDLFHPPSDPDDHVDLATVYAFPEFEIKAILLDTYKLEPYGCFEPGFIPVMQMNWLTGQSVPVAQGPSQKLTSLHDTAENRPIHEQAAINLLLKVLRESLEPVLISSVGSSRILAAALNRDEKLCKEKIKAVLLCAGMGKDTNIMLDSFAFKRVLESGLNINWFPCKDLHLQEKDTPWAHSVNFTVPHKVLFNKLDERLQNYFMYAYSGNKSSNIIGALHESNRNGVWWIMNEAIRPLWSPVMFLMLSGRKLIKTNNGWRFLPKSEIKSDMQEHKLNLIPVETEFKDNTVYWKHGDEKSTTKLFKRTPSQELNEAMGEALNALLRDMQLTQGPAVPPFEPIS